MHARALAESLYDVRVLVARACARPLVVIVSVYVHCTDGSARSCRTDHSPTSEVTPSRVFVQRVPVCVVRAARRRAVACHMRFVILYFQLRASSYARDDAMCRDRPGTRVRR